MAKWRGKIGFIKQVEKKPGVYVSETTERNYYGDLLRNSRGWSNPSEGTNDNLTLNNQISIIADSFISDNSSFIKYIEIMGSKWKITNIEINYPRFINRININRIIVLNKRLSASNGFSPADFVEARMSNFYCERDKK